MKKITLLLAAMLIATGLTYAGNDTPITYEELPANSRQFIEKHFASEKVSYVKMEKEFLDKSYEVIFVSSTKIEFSKNGEWKEIDCKYTAVPNSVVPAPILEYVNKRFGGEVKIIELEKIKRGGYEVKLNNDVELDFDAKFKLTDFDD